MVAVWQCQNLWVWELLGTIRFHAFTAFGRLNLVRVKTMLVTLAHLKNSSKTCVRVYTSYGTGNTVKLLSANDVTVFKILAFWAYREKVKLKVSQ
jgi:hypothetical protein